MNLRHLIVPIYLALCLLMGGSSAAGYISNMLLQFMGLIMIGLVIVNTRPAAPSRHAILPLILVGLLISIVLIQLIPLPPSIWTSLPGRDATVSGLAMLGVPPTWQPISLAPVGTVESAIWLIPAYAAFFGIVSLGAFQDRFLAIVIVTITVASVLIGALQLAGGSESTAYFYQRTNVGIAVGFFANGNHFSTLLVVSLPFIAALHRSVTRDSSRTVSASMTLISLSAAMVVLVGVVINGSLAGIGLSIPAIFASLLILKWKKLPRMKILAPPLALMSIAAAAIILWGPFGNNLFGADAGNNSDSRFTAFSKTGAAVLEYAPFGSGLGTFVPVYKTLEDPELIDRFYMNNAHNDYLQLALETGFPGIILMFAFTVWLIRRTVTVWREGKANAFEKAATIGAWTIMIHSLVDYPLRTAAISCLFAVCVALLAKPRQQVAPLLNNETSNVTHLVA